MDNKLEFKPDSSDRVISFEIANERVIVVVGFKGGAGTMGRGISFDEARELMKWIERELFARKLPLK